jgi:hypothetical protein
MAGKLSKEQAQKHNRACELVASAAATRKVLRTADSAVRA